MAPGGWSLLALIQVAICPFSVDGRADGFLVEKKGLRARSLDAEAFKSEVRNAMDEALGCGGEVTEEHLQATEEDLRKMFVTLPKNSNGRLERDR